MMKYLWSLTLALCALAAPAWAEGARVALVIGNAEYVQTGWALKNPVNDARAVADRLGGVGFDVTIIQDATESELDVAVRNFRRKISAAGEDVTALFFFAGHGMRADGDNWLLPVELEAEVYEDVAGQGVRLGAVIRQMRNAGAKTSLVIVNACRNDPLPRATMNVNAGRGMSPEGRQDSVLIAYAAAAGQVAYDYVEESDGLSPFTTAFLERIDDPEPVQLLFDRVSGDVRAATRGAQRPFTESGLGARSSADDFYFVRPAAVVTRPQTAGGISVEEAEAYALAVTCEYIEAYREKYPDGVFINEVENRWNAQCAPRGPALEPPSGNASALGQETWRNIVVYRPSTCSAAFEDGRCSFTELAWHPAGSAIAAIHYDGAVSVVSDDGEALLERTTELAYPVRLAWAPDGKRLAVADASYSSVFVLDQRLQLPDPIEFYGEPLAVGWAREDEIWALEAEGFRLCGARNGVCEDVGPKFEALRTGDLAWRGGDPVFAVGGENGAARVGHGSRWTDLAAPPPHPNPDRAVSAHVSAMTISPNGREVAVGRFDGRASVHSTATGELTKVLVSLDEPVNQIAWSLDGKRIALATEDRKLRVFDASNGLIISAVDRAHGSNISSIDFAPAGDRIATASLDGSIKVWALER